MKIIRMLVVVILSGFGSCASAQAIVNSSFEDFAGAFGADGGAELLVGQTQLTGWSIVSRVAILTAPNSYGLSPSSGNNFLDLTSYSAVGFGAGQGVEQVLSGLSVGAVYRVSMDLGICNAPCITGALNYGGPISLTASAAGTSQLFTHNSALPGNVWSNYSFTFAANSPSANLRITMASTAGAYVGLDNIAIVAVPENTTLLLFVCGLATICTLSKRWPVATATAFTVTQRLRIDRAKLRSIR